MAKEAKTRLLDKLTGHVGRENAIGMGELFEAVFGRAVGSRVQENLNATRDLRELITELRRLGIPILSSSSPGGSGYYLAESGPEMEGYLRRLRRRALGILGQEARLRRLALPELLGQMYLEEARGEAA
jgi:hypothetical protein